MYIYIYIIFIYIACIAYVADHPAGDKEVGRGGGGTTSETLEQPRNTSKLKWTKIGTGLEQHQNTMGTQSELSRNKFGAKSERIRNKLETTLEHDWNNIGTKMG